MIEPPGPHKGKFYVKAPAANDLAVYLRDLAETYGGVTQFKMGFTKSTLVNDPELLRQLLVTEHAKIRKSMTVQVGSIILTGKGLLSSEGELHKRQRRLIQPSFHRKKIRLYCEIMANETSALADSWVNTKEVDMNREMSRLTLLIIGKAMFGANLEEDVRKVSRSLEYIFSLIDQSSNPIGALKKIFRFIWARHTLHSIVKRIIRERRKSGEDSDDMLTMLLQARDEEGDGSGLSDKQARAEVFILYVAGHETTARALGWVWYCLSTHPEVEAKFHVELEKVLGGKLPNLEDLNQLEYTRQILEETMRLYPPAYAFDRLSNEPITLNGYTLPKNSHIIFSPYCMHRHPDYYPNPDVFDPERMKPEAKVERPKQAYLAFGAGPRSCIGEQFAWTEAMIVMAVLGQRFRIRVSPGAAVKPQFLVTLRADNLRMTLEPRY